MRSTAEIAKHLKDAGWPQPDFSEAVAKYSVDPETLVWLPPLKPLIDACIAKKKGNKEFALFFLNPGWQACIGLKYEGMMLGESPGEFEAEGIGAEEAVSELWLKL